MRSSHPKQRVSRMRETDPASKDHRVRNGAARREQTRRKLLVAALEVFAAKGTDAPLIDDFIAAAGVARGTFYNYFHTTQELLAAVTAELSDEILLRIDAAALEFDDPIERMVCGCLLYMHIAIDHPSWGVFMTRAGLRGDALGKLLDRYLPRDLELAWKAGLAEFPSVRAARDLVLGCMMNCIASVLSGAAPRVHLRETFQLALRGIGVSAKQAAELVIRPLPDVEMPSGFAFSNAKTDRKRKI